MRKQVALSSLIAVAFMAVLYPYTFRAWFQADDLGWLGLRLQIHSFQDFLAAMFAPLAQGTIRPLSERAFYLTCSSLFGFNALPYRIALFVLQSVNLILLALVTRRLTGSFAATVAAPLLWISNIGLAAIMTWTGSCSEVFCTLFLLLAFDSFLRGRHAAHWIFYLMAMGALEVTVMYPLALTGYAWLLARDRLKTVLPLWIPAVGYTIVHELVRTPPKTHVYDLHFDLSIITTFATYIKLAFGPGAAAETFPGVSAALVVSMTLLMAAALLAFVYSEYRGGNRVPLFGLVWFLAFLGPFLPVRDHVTNYYLTIPCIGLSLAAAQGIGLAPQRSIVFKTMLAACLLLYLGFSIPTTRADSKAWWARAVPVKKLVLGVKQIHGQDPTKLILLDGVADQLFWMAIYDHPFHLFGADVLLTTGAGAKLHPYPELADIADYTIPQERMNAELAAGRAVVYSAGGDSGELRDITGLFKAAALDNGMPRRVDIGHPPIESLLGPTWYPSEGDYRWMPMEATVRVGGPPNGHGALRISATCVPMQLPLSISINVDGQGLTPYEVKSCDAPLLIERRVDSAKADILVTLRVNHTVHAGADTRDLGLAVHFVEVVPSAK